MDEQANPQTRRDLQILEHIEQNPDTTQADLAARLGVAVGSVNWYLKRLIAKGYVEVQQMQRRKLRYLITPPGIAEKGRLVALYMRDSLRFYREMRQAAKRLLTQVQEAGYGQVCIEGDGDLAEICFLTCLEQGVEVQESAARNSVPLLRIDGRRLSLSWPEDVEADGPVG